jgi:mono/diheme cytochrome c family protein
MKKGMVIILLVFGFKYFLAQTTPKATTQSAGISKAVIDRGKRVYDLYCLACHQADGSGVPRMNPSIVKTKWVLGDKKTLITILLKGMDEEIQVNGETFHNVMAPHDHLKDQEIADVLTYIRNSFGNKASAVTSAEVKSVRDKMK